MGDERKKIISSMFMEVDQKVSLAKKQLIEARKAVDAANIRADSISIESIKTVERVNIKTHKRLNEEIRVIRIELFQSTQLEIYRYAQIISQEVTTDALIIAENILSQELKEDTNNS